MDQDTLIQNFIAGRTCVYVLKDATPSTCAQMEEALVGFASTEGEALNIADAKSALKRHLTYEPAFNVPKFGIRKKRSQNVYFDGNHIVTLL